MANRTEQDASTNLTYSPDISATACPDRYHNGINNGEFTTATKQSYIIAIIVNSVTCPFTVLLNVLVIMAVKKRPSLQNNANILLACLAVTDVLSGFLAQPSFILWKTFQLNGIHNNCMLREIHNWLLSFVPLLSVVHLSLVTAERLIAIKYALRYLSLVTPKNIRVAVQTVWAFCLLVCVGIISFFAKYSHLVIAFLVINCVLFILISYAILFCEIKRHRTVIKAQQQTQEEAERFTRENKAFKTTVFVVGALLASFVPMALFLLFRPKDRYRGLQDVLLPWPRTFAMLNSFFNPLIYCWRQKEIRKFVFRKSLWADWRGQNP